MTATKFQRLYICFRRQATRLNWSKHYRLSGWVKNQRWRPGTGWAHEIAYISACMHDSNDISTAIPMLSRSGIMTALVRILSYVMVSGISKTAANNRKCLRNNIYLSWYTWATTFQRLYICFQCQATRLDWSKHCRLSGWLRNQRWRPGAGSAYEIAYLSLYTG